MRCCLKYIILILTIVLILSGCKVKKDEDLQSDKKPAEPTTQARQEDVKSDMKSEVQESVPAEPVDVSSDRIAVTVDNVEITEKQLQERMAAALEKTMGMPENLLERYKKEIRSKALNDLIVESILDRKVAEAGIEVTDAEVDSRIQNLNTKNNMSYQDFLELLHAKKQDLSQYKENLRKNIGYEKLMKARFSEQQLTEEEFKEKSAKYILELKNKAKITYPPTRRVN